MLKQVTLFFNTGFNSINFPADPQTLYLFENKEYPAMDLVQENFLSAIKIKATEEDIIDADYLRIGDAYYSIEGYAMTSTDVVSFAVTQNAILSVGGIDELEYITGEVLRSTALDHIDMDFNDYTIRDEMLTFSERRPTLKRLAFGRNNPTSYKVDYEVPWTGDEIDIYVSAYDDQVPEKPSDVEVEELLGEAGAAAWDTIQSAWIPPAKFNTVIGINGHSIMPSSIEYVLPVVSLYTGRDILSAALTMNGFGVTNFITDSYTIPKWFVTYERDGGHINRISSRTNRAMISIGDDYSDVLDATRYTSLNDIVKQVIANQVIEVTIESIQSGESNTVLLSDLSLGTGEDGSAQILVDMAADPSPNGCPYFKLVVKDRIFETGTNDGNIYDILLGSIKGATWMRNPILFERTGFTRDLASAKINQAYRRTMFDNSKEYDYAMYFNNLTGKIANTASLGAIQAYDAEANLAQAYRDNLYYGMNNRTADNSFAISLNKDERLLNAHATNSGLQMNAMMRAAGNVVSAGQDWHAIQSNQLMTHGNMQAQYAAEVMQLGLAHPGHELEMRFPIIDNGQLLYGNGIMINVRSMSDWDLIRYIRILQQYGIACTGRMNRLLVSRLHDEPYHYIQAAGVTVKYADDATVKRKINKQLLKAITDMFAVGFRIWYEKPDDQSYRRMYVKEDQ